MLAVVFWVALDFLVYPAVPRNLFDTPEVFFFSVLLYPILEEIVFRGLIQGQLMLRACWRQCLLGFTWANIVTSLLFSLLHFVHQPPLMAALIFFPSLILGYFRDRYRRVLPSVWLHVFYNAGFLGLFFTGEIGL